MSSVVLALAVLTLVGTVSGLRAIARRENARLDELARIAARPVPPMPTAVRIIGPADATEPARRPARSAAHVRSSPKVGARGSG